MPKMPSSLKAAKTFVVIGGRDNVVSAGMYDHGAYEEDGPVTWEILITPRRKQIRWYREPARHFRIREASQKPCSI